MTKTTWTTRDAGRLPSVAEQQAAWDRLSSRERRHDLIQNGADPRDWKTGRVATTFETAPSDAAEEHDGDTESHDVSPDRGPPVIDYRQLVADTRRAQGLPAQLPAAAVDAVVRVGAAGGQR